MSKDDYKHIVDISIELFAANQIALHALLNLLIERGLLDKDEYADEINRLRAGSIAGEFTGATLNTLIQKIGSSKPLTPLSPEQLRSLLSVIDGGKTPSDDK